MGKRPQIWLVDFDSDAVIDFEDVKSRGDRILLLRRNRQNSPFNDFMCGDGRSGPRSFSFCTTLKTALTTNRSPSRT